MPKRGITYPVSLHLLTYPVTNTDEELGLRFKIYTKITFIIYGSVWSKRRFRLFGAHAHLLPTASPLPTVLLGFPRCSAGMNFSKTIYPPLVVSRLPDCEFLQLAGWVPGTIWLFRSTSYCWWHVFIDRKAYICSWKQTQNVYNSKLPEELMLKENNTYVKRK